MQEVTKTLIERLTTDWALSGKGNQTNITFRRGEPADLTARFVPKKISIEALKTGTPVEKRTLKRSVFKELVALHIWQLVEPKYKDRIDDLYDLRQEVIDEIRRIIKLRQSTMTNIRFSYLSHEHYRDEVDAEPPVLHLIMILIAKYTA